MTATAKSEAVGDREIVITRLINAPRARVFRAWTDPRQLAQWWGPHGYSNPVCSIAPRVGGALRIVMRSPAGADYPLKGEIREIVENEHLIYTMMIDTSTDAWREFRVPNAVHAVRFEDAAGGRTRLTVVTRLSTVADREFMDRNGHREGFTQSLERLETVVTHS